MRKVSIAPDGTEFPLPQPEDYKAEFERIRALADEQRAMGREVVVVMGLGFVGIVMAGVVADAVGPDGRPNKFVIGLQRPSARSFWKISILNQGRTPIDAEDPEVPEILHRIVHEKRNFVATYNEEVLSLADVVVVDVQCDIFKPELANVASATVEMRAFMAAIKTIGEYIPAECLTLIETTVPPGTTEQVVKPILEKRFHRRGIKNPPRVAHSYERVMPGREYVRSIRDYWRVCAGVDEVSSKRCETFLTEVLNTRDFPLTVLASTNESETAKIVENAWRAVNIAFSAEWGLFAEKVGVDLPKVLDAIRKRPTHQNVLFSGPGVGGYCLPKDGGFGIWAFKNFFNGDPDIFKITPLAININDLRGFHSVELVEEALTEMGESVQGAKVLLLGCAYREDVGDTRYSPIELIARKLAHLRAQVAVHDPYVRVWPELLYQEEEYDHSLARYFQHQEALPGLVVQKDLAASLHHVDAVVIGVRHEQYKALDPDWVVDKIGGPAAIIDCFGVLSDEKIKRYIARGCTVKGVSRGHITRIPRGAAALID